MTRAPHSARSEALFTVLVALGAALLAAVPEALRPGFYFHDDMQLQYVPAMVEIGRAARSGRLALLSDSSWFGGAFAGEYQHGVFSLVHVALCAAVADLSQRAVAASVSVFYYALAAAGGVRAARLLGLARPFAVSVALVAALNGFNVTWGSWLPAISGWAFLMWFWWALVRMCRAERWTGLDVAFVAFATYLVLASGWHFADLLLAPIGAAVLVAAPRGRPLRSLLVQSGTALVAGACLAAPPILCFLEYARVSARTDFDDLSWTWVVPLGALRGLLVPASQAVWHAFRADAVVSNVALAGGVLPFVVIGSAWRRRTRGDLFLLALAGAVLLWSMSPSLGRVRWPFRWLPAVHVLIALVAARVAQRDVESEPEGNSPERKARFRERTVSAAVGAALVIIIVFTSSVFDGTVLAGEAAALLSFGIWVLAPRQPRAAGVALSAGVALNLLAAPLTITERRATPHFTLDGCSAVAAKLAPDARYLGVYAFHDIVDPGDDAIGRNACLMPGNLGMLAGRRFVNGYSTLYSPGLRGHLELEVHGDLGPHGLIAATSAWSSQGGWLERWGIDGLVAPSAPYWPSLEKMLAATALRRIDLGRGVDLWQRDGAERRALLEIVSAQSETPSSGPRPRITALGERWKYQPPRGTSRAELSFAGSTDPRLGSAPVRLTRVTESSVEAMVHVATERPALLLLRRPYQPGYRARLGDRPLELGLLDATFVGVVLPAGASGRLTIEYAPIGVRAPGIAGVVLAMMLLAAAFARERTERRTHSLQR